LAPSKTALPSRIQQGCHDPIGGPPDGTPNGHHDEAEIERLIAAAEAAEREAERVEPPEEAT
jgi:hypothetical protein